MIEKMKMVCIVTSAHNRKEMLDGLKDLGLVHLKEKKNADRKFTEKFTLLSKVSNELKDYLEGDVNEDILSDEAFDLMLSDVISTLDEKKALANLIGLNKAEIDRIKDWGDFIPSEVKELKEKGFDLHFYTMGIKEYELLKKNEDIKLILLSKGKLAKVASLGKLPIEVQASEFILPERGITELNKEIESCNEKILLFDKKLKDAAKFEKSFNDQMLKAQNAENYSSANETLGTDSDFCWVSGYVPESKVDSFKETAKLNKWAYTIDDVADDDELVPTNVKYNKVSKLIKPIFDILGILPGYREQDISLWFLLFFSLFFAMIIGDGGYGVLILLGTVAINVKQKKLSDITFLLYVLSISTVIWGAVTGTWFGMESAMKVPFLKALVIPNFANYPEYFNVTAKAQQNTIMKFSFLIGAIQMALGAILAIKKKIAEKNLSFVADIGWIIAICAMYLLALYLVIGEQIAIMPIFILIGVAFLTVVLFGGMEPGISFSKGLKQGLGGAFTVFLNTISCFGNVMSYIRLFAVGMAGLAISQSFNNLAAGFSGPLLIAGAIIVIIGHALNIVMCFLSVVVHGVRLNVLEFSGQAGLEWAGIAYEPFKENDKIKK